MNFEKFDEKIWNKCVNIVIKLIDKFFPNDVIIFILINLI